ncbi:MAG: type II secretion system F family protein [Candidatus Heimdallarchaeota archaeon]|nr:MAG: type II secretion system F family protein [Candidatus Heimdallarchaeota archaeon]
MSKAIRRVGYLRFGRFLEPWIEKGRFERLNTSLKKAGMDISVRAYLGSAIFCSILVGVLSFVITTGTVALILQNDPNISENQVPMAVMVGVFVGVICGILTYLPFLYWPQMKATDRKILIEAGLPSTASYLSAMSSSGVPPDRLFYSLAGEASVAPEISNESKRITRDIEIFGYDILKALRTASTRSPSERFSKFLDGMSATITSGGDLTFFMSAESKALMKLKEEETKEFIAQLGVLAEIFMIVGVVAPLFFVVILAIVAVIAKDAVEAATILMLALAYFIMPILLVIMNLLISTISREI